jgi:hypothetical protein
MSRLDDGLEQGEYNSLAEGLGYWERELKKLDAGEVVPNYLSRPMTRAEVVETVEACRTAAKRRGDK